MASQSITIADIRTLVRQRTDTVNTTFVTDAELNNWISDSAAELWDLLVDAYGEDYFTVSDDLVTTPNSEQVVIPDGVYKLRELYYYTLQGSDRIRVRLPRVSFTDMMTDQRSPGWSVGPNYCNATYRIVRNVIRVAPLPTAAHTLEIWYVPASPKVVTDLQTLDSFNGWHEYIVCDVAIKVAQKDQADVSVFAAQKEAMKQRISHMKHDRDIGQANYVQDVVYDYYRLPPEWRR